MLKSNPLNSIALKVASGTRIAYHKLGQVACNFGGQLGKLVPTYHPEVW